MIVERKYPKSNGVVGGAIPDVESSLYLTGKTSKVRFLCSKTTTSQSEIGEFVELKVVVSTKPMIQPKKMS